MLVKSASKQAFRENVKTEIAAGRPQKQAVAIAYSTQRAAQQHRSSSSGSKSSAGKAKRSSSRGR